MDAWPTTERRSDIQSRDAFLPRRLPREGNAEGNSMQSIFLKETQGKGASTCPRGGQQVAENGGNERAVPMQHFFGLH